MSRLPRVFGFMAIVLCAGCYHATVETGAAPSNVVIRKSFASGWIFGLVPPSTIETQSRCPHGPAKVETQLSFVNQLVSFLTLSIYTPMDIKVTCAASGEGPSAVERNVPTTPAPRAPRAVGPLPQAGRPRGAAEIRTNNELLVSTRFSEAMTTALRAGIVTGFRELRPDTLTVDIADEALTSASTERSLLRLFLAYRDTTALDSEIALELLHDGRRVGLYTKQGLLWESVR